MTTAGQHIIADLRWQTSFDSKEKAGHLQERISHWSRSVMQRELAALFDKFCPPGQTWQIPSLEIDLGPIEFSEMEYMLARQLRSKLSEKLEELLLYRTTSGIENIIITGSEQSVIEQLRVFLAEGILPWNHKTSEGAPDFLMASQLKENNSAAIAMLRETGKIHEHVRRRMAWQFSDPTLSGIIKGLEPNNHSQIIDFTGELKKVQEKKQLVQAGAAEFRKNVWFWVLNYLFAERGTIFNRVNFMRSTIRQMASHYNLSYDQLLSMIETAVGQLKETTRVQPEFILALKVLSQEKSSDAQPGALVEDREQAWKNLEELLARPERRRKTEIARLNELILVLSRENENRFRELILAFSSDDGLYETIFYALEADPAGTVLAILTETNKKLAQQFRQLAGNEAKVLLPGVEKVRQSKLFVGLLAFLDQYGEQGQKALEQLFRAIRRKKEISFSRLILLSEAELQKMLEQILPGFNSQSGINASLVRAMTNSSFAAEFIRSSEKLKDQFADTWKTIKAQKGGQNLETLLRELDENAIEALYHSVNVSAGTKTFRSILLLGELIRRSRLPVQQLLLHQSGLKFLLRYPGAAYDDKRFIQFMAESLAQHTRIPQDALLERFFAAASVHMPGQPGAAGIYRAIGSVLLKTSAGRRQNRIEQQAAQLIRKLLHAELNAGAGKQKLYFLENSLDEKIRLFPKESFRAFAEIFRREGEQSAILLSGCIDDPAKWLNHSGVESGKLLSALYREAKNSTGAITSESFSAWFTEKLFRQGLLLLLEKPTISTKHFFAELFHALFALLPQSEHSSLAKTMQELVSSRLIRSFGIDQAAYETLFAPHREATPAAFIGSLLKAKGRQETLAIYLNRIFSERSFTGWRKTHTEEASAIISYLVRNGNELRKELLHKYTAALSIQLKQLRENEISNQLNELFWKCLVSYAEHNGNAERLRMYFAKAVQFIFPLAGSAATSDQDPIHKTKPKTGKSKNIRLENKLQLDPDTLERLFTECFETAAEEIVFKGKKIKFADLFRTLLKTEPKQFGKLFSRIKFTPQRTALLDASISIREFVILYSAIIRGGTKTALETLILLSDTAIRLSPAASDKLNVLFWQKAWEIIGGNYSTSQQLQSLIRELFVRIGKEIEFSADLVLTEMKNEKPIIHPELQAALTEAYPSFTVLDSPGVSAGDHSLLAEFAEKGMIESLGQSLLLHQEIPSWAGTVSRHESGKLMNGLVHYYPAEFENLIRRLSLTVSSRRWLARSVSMAELVRAAAFLHPERKAVLEMIAALYTALGKINFRSLPGIKIQEVLFEKLLHAWIHDNWKILAAGSIWNELIWEICTKQNVPKKEFLQELSAQANLFPHGLQLSLGLLLSPEPDTPAKKAELPVKLKKLVLKEEQAKVPLSGIPVKNAGMVLLNTYYPVLFERLGLLEQKKFTGTTGQEDAVHYLQFVVTGLQRTDESLLPLNKVLCGLPLSYPVKDGIEIPDEKKKLIEGLVKAAIAHWPSIGDTSINGFRGNWLVRDGILYEHPDKWELTIDKRAYDILLNKSPYSFSIIRYQWMDKPLHVNWPY